jgi:hypothetical protein
MSSRKARPASLSCSSSATRPRRWSPLEPGVELGGLPRTRSGVGAGWEAPPLFSRQKHLHRVHAPDRPGDDVPVALKLNPFVKIGESPPMTLAPSGWLADVV